MYVAIQVSIPKAGIVKNKFELLNLLTMLVIVKIVFMDKFYIYCRYEHWTKDGKQFTKWFKYLERSFSVEKEANEAIRDYKRDVAKTSKTMKIKYEFEARKIDHRFFMPKKLKRPTGRPKAIPQALVESIVSEIKRSKEHTSTCSLIGDDAIYLSNDAKAIDMIKSTLPTGKSLLVYCDASSKSMYIDVVDNSFIERNILEIER